MNQQEMAEIARARASFCAFLNVHFTTLPDLEFVERIRESEFLGALDALAEDSSAPEMAAGASLMAGFIRSTLNSSAAALSETLGIDRTRLYRGVSPAYGPPPPCEAVWNGQISDTATVLKALADVYVAAGMAMSSDARERLDYIGIELEFLRMLALRELEAWEAGQEASAKALLQQQSKFVGEHLVHWVPAFVERALKHAETDFYRGHLMMLRGFLDDEQ
ncbi:MAG: molecular chaperone TorD family protein [Candidatus Korobacteraceae bacterium]|jgi:TorA maturation chaperone TorD